MDLLLVDGKDGRSFSHCTDTARDVHNQTMSLCLQCHLLQITRADSQKPFFWLEGGNNIIGLVWVCSLGTGCQQSCRLPVVRGLSATCTILVMGLQGTVAKVC